MFETYFNYIVQLCKNKKKENPEEEQDPNKHFIIFKITDEKKNAVENIVLLVKKPDGNYSEKRTDNKGEVEIKNIEPGSCTIESDWRDLKKKNLTVFDTILILQE